MANSKSAEKRIRINRTKRAIKVAHKSALKTSIKRYLQSLEGDRANAQDNLKKAIRALDKVQQWYHPQECRGPHQVPAHQETC